MCGKKTCVFVCLCVRGGTEKLLEAGRQRNCVCLCVCVCERERERYRKGVDVKMCVCVCVCARINEFET